MTLPAYVGSGALAAGTGPTTPAFHASTDVDDIALLVVETENQDISPLSDAQGFTEIPNSPQFAGTLNTDPANRIAVYWKRITTTGGGTAPTTGDPTNHVTAALHTFRGCIATGDPWDPTPVGGNDGGANDTTGVIPGATTTVADCLVVLICGSSRNANATTTFSAWTNADLANLTERFDATSTLGVGGGHGMATGEKASAGAFGDTTVTLAVSSFKGAFSIALKPPGVSDGRSDVSFAELEVPSPDARSDVSFVELETPDPGGRSDVSFAELEVPTPDARSDVSFVELEVPSLDARGDVSFVELEIPELSGRGDVSFAELEVPDAPILDGRADVSFVELEVPTLDGRVDISFAELEVPGESGGGPSPAQYHDGLFSRMDS